MAVSGDFQMEYRGLLLGADPYIVRPPVEGLGDLPDLRTSDRTRLRRHGMLPGDDFAAGRTITVDVPIIAAGSAFAAAVDAFAAAFGLTEAGGQLAPLVFQVPGIAGGGVRRMLARVRKRALPVGPAWAANGAIASVMLDCPDPRIYDNAEQSVATSLAATPTGHTWNNTWPLSWGTAGVSGSISADNAGDFPTPPAFRIDGPVTNPSVENITDGLTLGFTITLGSGEFLEVDSDARTVLLGGTASRYSTLTTAQWFDLQPGVTELKFRGTTTGAPQLTATWRSAWL